MNCTSVSPSSRYMLHSLIKVDKILFYWSISLFASAFKTPSPVKGHATPCLRMESLPLSLQKTNSKMPFPPLFLPPLRWSHSKPHFKASSPLSAISVPLNFTESLLNKRWAWHKIYFCYSEFGNIKSVKIIRENGWPGKPKSQRKSVKRPVSGLLKNRRWPMPY